MMRPMPWAPAPPRGQYDRRLPREQRLAEQRERLLAAVARACALETDPSLAKVVRIAGVGRNTFYEYFDDVPHARREAESAALRRVEAKLRAAERVTQTPVERFRALARAWWDACEAEPAEFMLMLTPRGAQVSRGAESLQSAFERALATLAAPGTEVTLEPVRLLAVAATGEALARTRAGQLLETMATTPGAGVERDAVLRGFVDVAVRLLRE
jgi:hypothetical protein